ncbi:hypothetical protein DXM27_05120 [Rhizobium rhizogenes]|uniref:Uncharacterized protein n=1 Tax=Rhizobium rhizogenes TaxID=359 RepID=A0AA88F473_RHIRH|nr:hypothetical protein [Rhizobium rhizogenes]KAA3504596.1 hypothetical protein DXM27_05120 [Rhizobium rhizogenes]
MPDESLSIRREFSAGRINAVINHPDVRPYVGFADQGPVDLSEAVAHPLNFLLMGEGGGFFLHSRGNGVYEVHSQFLPDHRGRNVVRCLRDAAHWMFTRTDCVEIVTRVPDGNVAADALTRLAGFSLLYRLDGQQAQSGCKGGVKFYRWDVLSWIASAPRIECIGSDVASQAFGASASILSRHTGALIAMASHGHAGKGAALFNSFARLAGFAQSNVISASPVVIAIGQTLVSIDGQSTEVIPCQQQQ